MTYVNEFGEIFFDGVNEYGDIKFDMIDEFGCMILSKLIEIRITIALLPSIKCNKQSDKKFNMGITSDCMYSKVFTKPCDVNLKMNTNTIKYVDKYVFNILYFNLLNKMYLSKYLSNVVKINTNTIKICDKKDILKCKSFLEFEKQCNKKLKNYVNLETDNKGNNKEIYKNYKCNIVFDKRLYKLLFKRIENKTEFNTVEYKTIEKHINCNAKLYDQIHMYINKDFTMACNIENEFFKHVNLYKSTEMKFLPYNKFYISKKFNEHYMSFNNIFKEYGEVIIGFRNVCGKTVTPPKEIYNVNNTFTHTKVLPKTMKRNNAQIVTLENEKL